MKILVITQYFPPENAFYANSVVEELAKRGNCVKVLTGYPNYPSGQIFPGFKMTFRQRTQNDLGVDILRVPLYPDHSVKALKRILNYLSFGLSSATAFRWAKDVDVIYVYAPQPTAAIGPWLWRKMGGRPYVLHIQDLWPDSVLGSSMLGKGKVSRFAESIINVWLRNLYNKSSAVIGIAPGMIERLKERGTSNDLVHLLYNWSSRPAGRAETLNVRTTMTTFVFAGNIGEMQDVQTIIGAAEFLKDTPLLIKIVGDGINLLEVKEKSRLLNQSNVEFLGKVPREAMTEIYESADFSLVTLKDLRVFEGTIPSKFQGSIAHGLPIVTNVLGDLRDLVEQNGIGFTANPEDPESLAAAMLKAMNLDPEKYKSMVANTKKTFEDDFSTDSAISRLQHILSNVASAG